jgi:serine/threonine protein kinase
VDIWALGCILYELAMGCRAFDNEGAVFQFRSKTEVLNIELDEFFSESCKESIRSDLRSMLEVEPGVRPSASTLREIFSRHFEMTESYNVAESDTIVSNQPNLPEEPTMIENSPVADGSQIVSERMDIESPSVSFSPYNGASGPQSTPNYIDDQTRVSFTAGPADTVASGSIHLTGIPPSEAGDM